MHGTENSDTLQGFGDQLNLLYAGAGDDTVYAGGMNGDELYGEVCNDTLIGSGASETLDGGIGNDHLEGARAMTRMYLVSATVRILFTITTTDKAEALIR